MCNVYNLTCNKSFFISFILMLVLFAFLFGLCFEDLQNANRADNKNTLKA